MATSGITTVPSLLESITSNSKQYLTLTSSGKLYFLLNSTSLSGVLTIDLYLPIFKKFYEKRRGGNKLKRKRKDETNLKGEKEMNLQQGEKAEKMGALKVA